MRSSILVLLSVACSVREASVVGEDGLGVGALGVEPQAPASTEPSPPAELASFENPSLGSVPLFGGTLEAVPALGGALAADPEGDRLVWLGPDGVVELALGANARPFRVEIEGARAWATLRGTGEVVAVDLPSLTVAWRSKVCPEPRGLDHAPDGSLVVACAGGELVALDDAGTVDRWRLLPSDLRDVVSADGLLYVSRFRPGEVLLVDPVTLALVDVAPLGVKGRVAWRMRADPVAADGVLVVYDEVSTAEITAPGTPGTVPEYYVSTVPCASLHQARFAHVGPEGYATTGAGVNGAVLPVDFVARRDGTLVLVNGGGGRDALRAGLLDLGPAGDVFEEDCLEGTEVVLASPAVPSAVTEVEGVLYAQTTGQAGVHVTSVVPTVLVPVWSSGAQATDDALRLFHRDPGTGVACASCHPEGQDDGHVWLFGAGIDGVAAAGPRRTLTVAGALAERAPYHWMGELPTPAALVASTFTAGMGGGEVDDATAEALFAWLGDLRPVHRTSTAPPERLAAGEAVFEDAGCASCHSGVAFTNNELVQLRAGPVTKTPTLLGVGMHTSFMHDGCAPTLLDRFVGPDSCTGGDEHGAVSLLSEAEVTALVAFLETL